MVAHSPAASAASAASDSDSESHNANQLDKGSAIKDKECQYCHQKFTSSSLGRHLDQFIHKKKPDGLHIVDEIRRLRGGITRRTARNSKKQDLSQDARGASTSTRPSPAPATQSAYADAPVDRLNSFVPGGTYSSINRLNWHSTGVITDPAMINPSPSSTHTPANITGAPVTGSLPKKRSFSTYASDLPATSHTLSSTSPTALADTARALELSLREVLDTLRAASKHINTPPTPFEFDIQSQSFPSLVLKLLPAPSTLLQTAPFPTLQSIPLQPPGPDQRTTLRNRLTWTIDRWKWNALRLAQRTTSNIADEASFLSSQADSYTSAALAHLNACYEHWMSHSPDARDSLWHVELLRAFQAARDRQTDMEERMDELAQERNQLKQQVEYLSRCQWPREMALWPPERLTYGRKMREEVSLVNLQRPVGAVLKTNFAGTTAGAGPGAGVGSAGPGPGSGPGLAAGGGGPASLNRANSEGAGAGAGPEEMMGGAAAGATGAWAAGAFGGPDATDDEDENPNMITENVNTRGDKWDFDKLVGKWRAHVKEDRLRRVPWSTAAAQNNASSSANGGGVGGGGGGGGGQFSASPAADGMGGKGANGAGAEGSPGLGTGPGGAGGEGEGSGIGVRRDKKPFGKDNNILIVSDW